MMGILAKAYGGDSNKSNELIGVVATHYVASIDPVMQKLSAQIQTLKQGNTSESNVNQPCYKILYDNINKTWAIGYYQRMKNSLNATDWAILEDAVDNVFFYIHKYDSYLT